MKIKDIKIIDILQDGRGVGKADSKVYFIEKAIFGEICDIEIINKKKNFIEAKKIKTKKEVELYAFQENSLRFIARRRFFELRRLSEERKDRSYDRGYGKSLHYHSQPRLRNRLALCHRRGV